MSNKPQSKSFVINRLKIGSTTYSIYKNNGSYTLYYSENGKKIRRTFKTVAEAKKAARLTKASKSRKVITLSGAEVNEYRACLDIINTYTRLSDLDQRPRIDTLVQEALTLRRQRGQAFIAKSTAQVYEELKQQKISNGCSKQTILDMNCLKSFIKMFPGNISDLTNQDIIEWNNKAGRGKASRTKANYQNALINLFNFAQNMEYLPDGTHAAHVLKKKGLKAKKGVAKVEIWSPDDWVKIINKSLEMRCLGTVNKVTVMVAMAGFAGLRTSEIARLNWEDILWDTKYIRVPAHKSKNNKSHRRVPMSAELESWLRLAGGSEENSGSMVNVKDRSYVTERIVQTVKAAKLKHIPNGLRHSCISAWIAQGNEIGTVSFWADNSPAIIRSNYLGEITKENADAWHSVLPPTDK